MYIMYVDESGDSGVINSPTENFALSGITVHESRWREFRDQLVSFRRTMRTVHGLPMGNEIHAGEFIRKPPIATMARHTRLAILRNLLDELAKIEYISITNVVIEKNNKPPSYDIFEMGWRILFQRFENTIRRGNFPGSHRNDKGLIIVDSTDGPKLQKLTRKMSTYNPIPNQTGMGVGHRNLPTVTIIEDPHHKNSADSYFIQAADVSAYFLRQKLAPNAYIKRQGASNYFNRLAPVLNTKARKDDEFGIVRI